jgi:hypothetical protein
MFFFAPEEASARRLGVSNIYVVGMYVSLITVAL